MEHQSLPQVPLVPNFAYDREQFVQALVTELRGHQMLSDRSHKALIGHVDELTESQLIAPLQAMGVWNNPLAPATAT